MTLVSCVPSESKLEEDPACCWRGWLDQGDLAGWGDLLSPSNADPGGWGDRLSPKRGDLPPGDPVRTEESEEEALEDGRGSIRMGDSAPPLCCTVDK